MSTASALAEMLRARAERLDRFAEWEKSHPPRLTTSVAIAAAGALYQLLPLASRQRPIDTSGIARMHHALRHLAR